MGTVSTIADLRSKAVPSSNGAAMMALGYYAAGKGGGGLFVWDALSALDDDGGTVIRPNANPAQGRWLRQCQGPMSMFDFGAGLRAGQSDDTANVQAAIAAALRAAISQTCDPASTEIRMPATAGGYPVTSLTIAPTTPYGITIRGEGKSSRFRKYGAGTDPIINLLGTSGTSRTSRCKFADFAIEGTAKAHVGLRAESVVFDWEGVQISGCATGLLSVGAQDSYLRRGSLAGNGTAFVADSSSWSSNLLTFDGVTFSVNDLAGQLDKADALRFNNCNINGNTAGFAIGGSIGSQANRSSLIWDSCWWEANGEALIDGDPTFAWIVLNGGTWYSADGRVRIGGNQNRVDVRNVHDLSRLEVSDAAGRVSIRNSQIYSYALSVARYEIANSSTVLVDNATGETG